MGKTPNQKRQKEIQQQNSKKKKSVKRKKPEDPRTTGISIAGPLKIIKKDGTVIIEKASPGWRSVHKTDFLANPYRKPRPRKL